MLQAIYKGKIINSFDIQNEYGYKEKNTYEEYKIAGSKGLITCEECGTEVYLRAGDINIPHFAHKDSNRVCYHKMHKESEEQKKGKIAIYKWLNSQYDNVYIDKTYGIRRANVSLESEKGIIAIQYIRNQRDMLEWNEKREDYVLLGVKDLYVFGYKGFNIAQDSQELFRQIVQKYSSDNTIKILNAEDNEIILMRYIDFLDKEGKLFYNAVCYKRYEFNSIKLNLDGTIESDFDVFYTEELEKHRIKARDKYKTAENEKRRKAVEMNNRNKIKEEVYINRKSSNQSLHQTVEKPFQTVDPNHSQINTIWVSDEFLKEHIQKYSNPKGLTAAELDIEVKDYIKNNMSPNCEWWFGKSKQVRFIRCRYCGKYYISNFCVKYKYHSGTCYNCYRFQTKETINELELI